MNRVKYNKSFFPEYENQKKNSLVDLVNCFKYLQKYFKILTCICLETQNVL